MGSKIEDKFVALKVPKDLHIYLKKKAKASGMTMGNYLFDSICKHHGIEFVPATVVIPEDVEEVVEEPVEEVVEEPKKEEEIVPEEIQNDINDMEQEEVVEEVIEQPEKVQDINQI